MVPAAFVGAMFIYYELRLALGDLGFVLISLVSIGAGVDTFSFTFRKLRIYMSN
jgi:hypothetical protein